MEDWRSGLVPFLIVEGASKAIEFYRDAFGAEEAIRTVSPDGRVIQAVLRINGGTLYVGDMFIERGGNGSPTMLGGTTVTMHLTVDDPDRVFGLAVAAGATPLLPLQEMFWGQRFGKVRDPFGYHWVIATPQALEAPPGLDTSLKKHFR